MNETITTASKPASFAGTLFLMQIAFCMTVIFNIPVARQIIGFLYLTFVPGFVIVHLLKLKLERTETILFSVGLSTVFIIGVGFAMNSLGPLLGVSRPLDLIPLMIVTNIIVFFLVLYEWHSSEKSISFLGGSRLAFSGLIFAALPVISVVGTLLVDVPPHTNNSVLLLMLIIIASLVALAAFSRKLVPSNLYPLIMFFIALALVLHYSLFSNYVFGGDIFGEYSAFRLTQVNSLWNSAVPQIYYSMLSVTIFPTIYSNVLGLEGTWVFKIIFPSLLALVPVGLYSLFKSRFGKGIVFFSVFFFVSDITFFTELTELARQIMGELFYVLLFLTIFNDSIKGRNKAICFVLFGFGLVVSHYALSYLFLAFIFVLWLISLLKKRSLGVTASMAALFGAMTFAWYIYVSSSVPFNQLLSVFESVQNNFVSNFFNPQSRGTTVLESIGVQGLSTFWHLIGRSIAYITEVLIVIGLLALLVRKRRSFSNDGFNIMAFLNMLLLVACIVLPNFSTSFNATRFYQVSLFFLAPFCIMGGIGVLSLLTKKKVKEKYLVIALVLMVLIPYFLFQTGFVYEVTRDETSSLPLSSYRFSPLTISGEGVILESEVSGARWLAQFNGLNKSVYADIDSGAIFDYSNIQNDILLTLGTPIPSGSYVYLNQYNIYDGIFFSSIYSSYNPASAPNVNQIVPSLNTTNMIYSSGSCAVYEVPPS